MAKFSRFAEPRRALTGVGPLIAGGLLSAFAAYAYQLIGARALGVIDFAPVGVLWTMQFLGATVIHHPIEQTIARRMTLGEVAGHRSVVRFAATVTALAAAVAAVFAVAARVRLFDSLWLFVLLAPLVLASDGLMAVAKGFLAGRSRYRAYALAVAGESVIRLVAGVALLQISTAPAVYASAIVVGPLAALLVSPFRGQFLTGEEPTHRHQLVFFGPLVAAAAAAQLLLAGAPIVVGLLLDDVSQTSIVFVTVTLFRGPLSMSYPLLTRVLVPFTQLAVRDIPLMVTRVRLIAGSSLPMAGLAFAFGYVVGPAIVAGLFGSDFRPQPMFVALVAAAVVMIGAAQFAGQALVAVGHTKGLAIAWWMGIAGASAIVAFGRNDVSSTFVAAAMLAGSVVALGVVVGFSRDH